MQSVIKRYKIWRSRKDTGGSGAFTRKGTYIGGVERGISKPNCCCRGEDCARAQCNAGSATEDWMIAVEYAAGARLVARRGVAGVFPVTVRSPGLRRRRATAKLWPPSLRQPLASPKGARRVRRVPGCVGIADSYARERAF